MSWISYNTPIKNTADDNITCYKVFHKTDITWRVEKTSDLTFEPKIKEIKSLYKQYKYIPYNINPKIDIIYKWDDIENAWYTDEGYYSYISLNEAKKCNSHGAFSIIECIIPKDTEYYINENNEIISSNIIVTDKIVK